MFQAKVFIPQNRLAKVLGDVGASFEDLVAESERRIDRLSTDIRAYVAEQLALILRICEEGDAAMLAHHADLADAAIKIAEVAGAGGLPQVSEVARGLQAMLDALASDGVWRPDALQLHVAVLAMLVRKTDLSEDEIVQLLGSMIRIRRSIGAEG